MKSIKITVILAGVCLLGSCLFGQKEDYVWILGSGNERVIPKKPNGGVNLIFNDSGGVDTLYVPRKTVFNWANASICDPEGNLLFYTNGNYVSNRLDQVMKNGDGLGEEHWGPGNPMRQGFIALPYPGHPNQYMIIHSNWEWRKVQEGNTPIAYNLKYTLVDMTQENGLGAVVEKNVVISNEEHAMGGLTACRHANGRDWWVLKPGYDEGESVIETYLLDPSGLRFVTTQYFQGGYFSYKRVAAHTTFSPNGNHFIFAQGWSIYESKYIHIFSFDRCTGILTLSETIEEPENGLEHAVVVSPNSRFLYNIKDTSVYQYDLYADTIANSKVLVAEYDGFVDRVVTYFNLPALGPDGRIYINTPSNSHYLHVIEKPNLQGIDCEVRQHSFRLPAYNIKTMPNFPHFRLGKLEGSPCDTLISSSVKSFELGELRVHPNPASDYLVVDLQEFAQGEVSATLISQHGTEVLRVAISGEEERIDVSRIPAGVYILTVRTQSGQTAKAKCVIQR
jgi:hypothetical protein